MGIGSWQGQHCLLLPILTMSNWLQIKEAGVILRSSTSHTGQEKAKERMGTSERILSGLTWDMGLADCSILLSFIERLPGLSWSCLKELGD